MESQTYDDDLELNEVVMTSSPINGVERYWMARAFYRLDVGEWKEKITSVWLVDANGNSVEYA